MLSNSRTFAALAGLVLAGTIFAQGSAADYQRSQTLGNRFRGLVRNDEIRPRWIEGSSNFTYLRELTNGGSQIILVEPEAGARGPAFNHERLASELGGLLGRRVDADRLPLERYEMEDRVLHFMIQGDTRIFSYAIPTNRLTSEAMEQSRRFRLPDLRRPIPSRDLGEGLDIILINMTDKPLDVFWVTREGQLTQYGTLQPGQQRRQNSTVGHVWQFKDKEGTSYGVYRTSAEGGIAVATAPSPPPPPPAQPRGAGASPDGKWRAYVRDNNLFIRSNQGEEEIQLSTDGKEGDAYSNRVFWSPDSKRLIGLRTEEGDSRIVSIVESSPRNELQPELHQFRYLKPGDKVPHPRPQLFDIDSKTQLPVDEKLFPNPYQLDNYRWSSDSKQFFFRYVQRGHQVVRVIGIDSATGNAKAIVNDESQTFVEYAGKSYLRWLDETNELVWMSERDGWNHLYLIDSRTGEVKSQITGGDWVVREVVDFDAEKRQMRLQIGGYYEGQDPYFIHYARVNFDGSGFTMLTEGDGTHSIDFSPDGKYIFDSYSRVDMAPVTELRDAQTGTLVTELEKADWSALVAAGWKMPEPFVTTARDNKTPIYGVIFHPSNFDPNKKYPVIENIYAGPQGAFTPKGFREVFGHQQLAELGFIVVQLDGMGTSQRSKAFHDVCWKNLGDAGFPDRIKWMKAAAADRPWMDLDRVGIYGTSAGGQNALGGILQYPEFYKAAVADCGCHDNRMDKIWWNELWMSYPIGPHYDEQSNVTMANQLQGDLLLMVGEMDTNVDPASTMQVVDALIRANKDFDLLVAPGVGHGVAGTPYGRRRLYDFFVRSLLKQEPRWE